MNYLLRFALFAKDRFFGEKNGRKIGNRLNIAVRNVELLPIKGIKIELILILLYSDNDGDNTCLVYLNYKYDKEWLIKLFTNFLS